MGLSMFSCRTPLVARGHPLLSRTPQYNRRHSEQPLSLVLSQIWSPLSKESSRKLCIVCRTWTRYTSCLRVVTPVHLNLRIRTSPSTTSRGIPIPRHRIILKRHCRFSLPRVCSPNWTSRRCSTSSITTLGHIHSRCLYTAIQHLEPNKLLHHCQVPGGQRTEAAIVEVPREVPHVVPEAFRTSGNHGRIRAGGVRVFRLGRLVVSKEKERLPI
jgi:hypothetical protein